MKIRSYFRGFFSALSEVCNEGDWRERLFSKLLFLIAIPLLLAGFVAVMTGGILSIWNIGEWGFIPRAFNQTAYETVDNDIIRLGVILFFSGISVSISSSLMFNMHRHSIIMPITFIIFASAPFALVVDSFEIFKIGPYWLSEYLLIAFAASSAIFLIGCMFGTIGIGLNKLLDQDNK